MRSYSTPQSILNIHTIYVCISQSETQLENTEMQGNKTNVFQIGNLTRQTNANRTNVVTIRMVSESEGWQQLC